MGNFNPDTGHSIRELLNNLHQNGMSNLSENALRDACRKMSDDGILYSTIDDDHFLPT